MSVPRLRCEIGLDAGPLSPLEGEHQGMVLDGDGDYASTPDSAQLGITGRIFVGALFAPPDWTTGTWRGIATKGDFASQRSWQFYLRGSAPLDRLSFHWSATGTGGTGTVISTAAPPGTDGEDLLLGVDFEPDIGGDERRATFYYKAFDPDMNARVQLLDPSGWTQLGTAVVASGATSLFNSDQPLLFGSDGAGADLLANTRAFVVKDGGISGTVVADPDFSTQPAGTTPFTDDAGNEWAYQGDAHIAIPPGIDWTDVTPRIRGTHDINPSSRQHELGRYETGTSAGDFDNRDRFLDPISIGGVIRPRLPIRYLAEYQGETFPLYTGYIESDKLRYSRGVDGFVHIESADVFKHVARLRPAPTPYAQVILDAQPSLYWRLGELRGDTAKDSSGGGIDGAIGEGVTLGVEGGLEAEDSAAMFFGPHSLVNAGDVFNFERTDPFAIAFRIRCPATEVASFRELVERFDVPNIRGWQLAVASTFPGLLRFLLSSSGSNRLRVYCARRIDDGLWHQVVLHYDGSSSASGVTWMIDGADAGLVVDFDTLSATTQNSSDLLVGQTTTPSSLGYDLQDLAIFEGPRSLDLARELYDTGRQPLGAQRPDERVGRILDLHRWPQVNRDLGRSVATLGPIHVPISALEDMQRAAESEVGTLYVAPDGKVTTRGRYDGIFQSQSVTSFGEADDIE